jgi:hypothetical protein
MRPLRVLALVACWPAAAFAQEAPPPPPPPAEAQPAPETPPPAPEAASAAATGTPTVEDRLTNIEGKLEGMEEPTAATNATVDALKKIKVSGYIQGRYEWHDDAGAGLDPSGRANRGTSRFLVRRGRLKTTYVGHMAEYMLQIDATPDGVVLKDAEASLVLDDTVFPSPTPWELKLTMGQFKAPFGFEVLQSSGDREMPERSFMIRTFFPGERDRGARLNFKYGAFKLQSALINGNVFPAIASFTTDTTSSSDPYASVSYDSSSYKDLLGRVGADFEFIVFGVSGYWGHTIWSKAASGTTPASYTRYSRARVGADVQGYIDVPALGGLVLRGEVIYGVEKNLEYAGVAKDPCKDIKSLGWYATLVQNIGDHVGVVFRVDQFNRNMDLSDTCSAPTASMGAMANTADAKIDKLTTFGGGLMYYVSGNLKASAIYEHLGEQGAVAPGKYKKDNDIFTLQLQAKF